MQYTCAALRGLVALYINHLGLSEGQLSRRVSRGGTEIEGRCPCCSELEMERVL